MSEAPPPASPEPLDPQPSEAGSDSPSPPALDSSALDTQGVDSPPEPPWARRVREAPWILLAFALALALIHSQFRPLDGDEGFYASAIHLVTQGEVPHRDFFSTQTPLHPYVYAPAELLAGRDLLSLRLWSVLLLGLAFASLIAWAKARLPPRGALLATLVLLTSVGMISWSVCVKTYAGLNAFLALALLLLWHACLSGRRAMFLAAGLVLGLATGVRLFGVVPWGAFGLVCLACALRGSLRERARRALAPLLVGYLIGLLPTLALASMSPEATYFGVWRYHQLRAVAPPFLERLQTLGRLLILVAREQPQLVLLAGLALGGGVHLKQRWSELPPGERLFWLGAGASLAAYSLANATPWPTFPQYFTATIPIFLFPFAGLGCTRLAKQPRVAILVAGLALVGASLGFIHPGRSRALVQAPALESPELPTGLPRDRASHAPWRSRGGLLVRARLRGRRGVLSRRGQRVLALRRAQGQPRRASSAPPLRPRGVDRERQRPRASGDLRRRQGAPPLSQDPDPRAVRTTQARAQGGLPLRGSRRRSQDPRT